MANMELMTRIVVEAYKNLFINRRPDGRQFNTNSQTESGWLGLVAGWQHNVWRSKRLL